MIKWIKNNKEWIFSGVGGVIFIGIITMIGNLLPNKPSQSDLPSKLPHEVVIPPQVPTQVVIPPQPAPIKVPLPDTPPIDPEVIIKTIRTAPLLQQPEIVKHYYGIRVEWTGRLFSIDKWDDSESDVTLSIGCGSKYSYVQVYGKIKPTDYPGLGLLRRDDPIRISGVIDDIDYGLGCLGLRDMRLVSYAK
jgi:hypothetical protein